MISNNFERLLLFDPLTLISGENLPPRLNHGFQDLKSLKISFTDSETWDKKKTLTRNMKYLQSVILGLLVGGELKDCVHLLKKLNIVID